MFTTRHSAILRGANLTLGCILYELFVYTFMTLKLFRNIECSPDENKLEYNVMLLISFMDQVLGYRFSGEDVAIRLQALFLSAQKAIVYWPFDSVEGIHSLLGAQNDFYVVNRGEAFILMDDVNGRDGIAMLATINDQWWARLGRQVIGAVQIPMQDKAHAHIIFSIGWRRRLVTLPCDLINGLLLKDPQAVLTESEYWPNVGFFASVHQKLVEGAAVMTNRLNGQP